jgi:quercetin dioxygenase-like cupin family protein
MSPAKGMVSVVCFAASAALACVRAQTTERASHVVGWNEGEVLLDRQGRTNSIIAGPSTGFTDLAVVTQDLPPGTRINLHRHDRTEEVIFVHAGSGILTIDDQQFNVREGDTIRVPRSLARYRESGR